MISKYDLVNELTNFRNIIQAINFSKTYNLIFFNTESFLQYIHNISDKRTFKNMQKSWKKLEPYVPYVISEKNLDFIMEAAIELPMEEMHKVEEELKKRMQMDFIKMTKKIKDENDWVKLMDLCEEIRQKKENRYRQKKFC